MNRLTNHRWGVLGASLLSLGALACTKSRTAELNLPPPTVVDQVDLNQYAGKWYEIARLPNSFQKGCTETTATYTIQSPTRVTVLNECDKLKGNGKTKHSSIKGHADVVKGSSGSKLKVTFLWPFKGDYWIIDLADDYSHAVVGTPSRNNLWVLSRSPQMPDATYRRIVERMRVEGFEVEQLMRTKHSAGDGEAGAQSKTSSALVTPARNGGQVGAQGYPTGRILRRMTSVSGT